MRRLVVLSLFVLASPAGFAQAMDRSGLLVDGDFGPVVAEITYGEPSGELRRAVLSFTPTSRGGAPPWNGEVDRAVVVTDEGVWHVVDRLLSSEHQTGVVQAEALLPAPESVVLILLHSTRDPWRGWLVRDAEGYANQEVSYVDQRGRTLRTGPCDPERCLSDVADARGRTEATATSLRLAVGGRTR